MRFWKRDAPAESAIQEVQRAAAPLEAKLEQVREEHERLKRRLAAERRVMLSGQ